MKVPVSGSIVFNQPPKKPEDPGEDKFVAPKPGEEKKISNTSQQPDTIVVKEEPDVKEGKATEIEKKYEPTEEEVKQHLSSISKKSESILLKISTIWYFDPFPDDLVIDGNKVSIVTRNFFWSEQIYSIPIKDIVDVTVETSPLSSTLVIIDERYKDQPVKIGKLRTEDAKKAQKIIQGLVLIKEQSVDFAKIEPTEVVDEVEKLGKVGKSD